MKKNYIILTVILLCLMVQLKVMGQLTGSVTLSGQSIHTGIKVKFVPNFGGMLDSCYTNSAGIYSVNITTGNYRVWFSYPGFQTIFHSAESGPQLNNSSILPNYTIDPGTAVYLTGAVSGTWSSSKTYYIENSAYIAPNTTLNIQPGTTVKFISSSSLFVQGKLVAAGVPGQRILFTHYLGNWDGISVTNQGTALIDFCTLEYASNGIDFTGSEIVISNNILRYNAFNIEVNDGPAIVEGNEIYDFSARGIVTGYNSTATISCNHIYNTDTVPNYATGIITQTSNLVLNNHIHQMLYGIAINGYGNPTIENNYIHNNTIGINLYIDYRGLPLIINNTLLNNNWYGLIGYDINKAIKFINNIVVGSDTALFLNDTLICENNLFYGCITDFSTFMPVPGIGQITGNNSNGDQVDAYNNIFQDPLFAIGQVPYLQSGSPALNAGKPIYSLNIGADPHKICYSNLTVGEPEYFWPQMQTIFYPNPTEDGKFTIRSKVIFTAYELYDSAGHLLKSVKELAGYSAEVDLSEWQKGLYFVKLISTKGIAYGKIFYN